MTIKDYLDGLERSGMKPEKEGQPSFVDTMKEIVSIWSNDAARGYAIAAAEAAGLTPEQIGKLMGAMGAAFEEMTVEEAESYYLNGDY